MTEEQMLAPHPSVGELVREVDDQLTDLEHRRLLAHLAECERCSRRFADLEHRSLAVGEYLRKVAEDARPSPLVRARALAAARAARHSGGREATPRRRALVAIAAVAGLALVLAGVDPLRAWILEQLGALRGAGAPQVSAPPVLPAHTVRSRGATIAFIPTGEVFELRIASRQAAGLLVVRMRPVPRATAQIEGSSEETMLVLPSGLLVENRASSHASYTVVLPATLREVRVHVGDRHVATLIPQAGSEAPEQVIPLSDASR